MASSTSLLLLLFAFAMLMAISAHPHHHHHHHRHHHRHQRRHVEFPSGTFEDNEVEYLNIPPWMEILKTWTKDDVRFVKGGMLGNYAEGRKNCEKIISEYSYRTCKKVCETLKNFAVMICDNRVKYTREEMIEKCCPPRDD